MKKQYLLFDLDGTISDPKTGITKSVQYSLKAFGINIADPDELIPFIGPPLRDSYKNFYGFSDAEAEKAVEKYREYFTAQGIFENTLYPGMAELLSEQYSAKKQLIVATSKPTVYAEKILKHFNIDSYFSFVAGSELDGRRSKKDLVIRHALETQGITRLDQTIMIGDKEHDIIGAKKVNIDSIGVLYGYGGNDELRDAGADHIVETIPALASLLCDITQ